MPNLQQEYIDFKDIKHRVEHLTLAAKSNDSKEQILEELLHALTKSGNQIHS